MDSSDKRMDVLAPIKIVSSHLTCFLCLSDTGGGLCPSEQKQLQPASRASVGVLESNWWKSYLKLFFVFRDFTFMMYHQHFDCKILNQISIVAVIQPIHTISTRCKNSPSWSNSLKIDSCNLQLNLAKSWDQTRLFWVGVINVINCQPIKQHCHRGVVASPGAGLTLLTMLMWGSGECCKISACLPSVSWHYITLLSTGWHYPLGTLWPRILASWPSSSVLTTPGHCSSSPGPWCCTIVSWGGV